MRARRFATTRTLRCHSVQRFPTRIVSDEPRADDDRPGDLSASCTRPSATAVRRIDNAIRANQDAITKQRNINGGSDAFRLLMYPLNRVDERSRARWALGALGTLLIALGGCVAQIKEARLYGAARPALDARSVVITERRTGVDGTVECRDIAVTAPMVREVEIRRSFADDAQDRNAAMAMLVAAGMGLVAYGQDQVSCPQGGGCADSTSATYALLGLAAIPIGFLAYNAMAVQDSRVIEGAAPESRPGPWRACSEPQNQRMPRAK
jgi:hypothetical protein